MCFKYEDEYSNCFDHLFLGDEERDLVKFLEREYNIELVDSVYVKKDLFKLLEKWHEEKKMKPCEVKE